MSCSTRTRSSKRRATRNIKPPRCISGCCENNNSVVNAKKSQTPKLQTPKNNALNKKKRTSVSKQKTTTQTKREKDGTVGTKKKSFTSPLFSESKIDKNVEECVVLLTPLPQRTIRKKSEVHQIPKETVITNVDSKVNVRSSARNAKKKDKLVVNKIVECENENKTPIAIDNYNVNNKNKRPVLRSRRKTNDTEQTPNVNNNVKKDLGEKKLVSSTVKEDTNSLSNITLNNENTTNKHDIPFKKPVLSNSSKLANNTSLAPVSKLRKRKTFNYAESSLDSSSESQKITENNTNKVPIYKQPVVENKKRKKRPGDLYEFDESDNENVKKKKRRKVSHSSSEEYDVTINNILKNVLNKVKKKNKNEIYSDARNNNVKNKQIKSVPSTNTKKIENCAVGCSKENKKPTDKREEINTKEQFKSVSSTNTKKIENCAVGSSKENKNPVTQTATDKLEKINTKEEFKSVSSTNTNNIEDCAVGPSKENKNPVTQTATDKLKEINTKEEAAQSSETSQMPQEINQVNNLQVTVENLGNSHDSSDTYDFEKDETESRKTISSKIKIISDIQLQPGRELNLTVATPTTFRESRPNANSTMLNNVFTPWRFNEINIKRNPHFLSIKESSLPCITQEMVLDHTIVDKFEDITKTHSGKTPQRRTEETVKKTPVQKYVTDYFGGGKENNKENMDVSLFDYDQFSPIKSRNQAMGNADHVKRKILGERNDNVANQILSSTPRHAPTSSDDQLTNFGFSSDEESNGPVAVKKNKEDKPFRVSVNLNDKKYTRPRKVRLVEPVEPSNDEESDLEELSDLESHSGEVKLFEDFNATEDLLKEPKFSKKRTKLKGFNDDNHKQRRKKDVRTKEEEDEAEKWASAFNSMCEEIEKFPLEIE